MDRIEFIEGLPFPISNLDIYRNIYPVEQWLRRILYAALRIHYGLEWQKYLPVEIISGLKKRRGSLKGRIFLNCENNENIIWLSTLDELHGMMISEPLWPIIRKLTEFTKSDFSQKLNSLREIRNIIMHNRAATQHTLNICQGILNSLNNGIHHFQNILFYKYPHDYDDNSDDLSNIWSSGASQDVALIGRKEEYFYSLSALLFKERKQCFVDIAEILEIFKDLENIILAIDINIYGGEFGVIWPQNTSEETFRVIEKRVMKAETEVWVKTNYIGQNPQYLCDPKIWYYYGGIPPWEKGNEEPLQKRRSKRSLPKGLSNKSSKKNTKDDNIILFPKK